MSARRAAEAMEHRRGVVGCLENLRDVPTLRRVERSGDSVAEIARKPGDHAAKDARVVRERLRFASKCREPYKCTAQTLLQPPGALQRLGRAATLSEHVGGELRELREVARRDDVDGTEAGEAAAGNLLGYEREEGQRMGARVAANRGGQGDESFGVAADVQHGSVEAGGAEHRQRARVDHRRPHRRPFGAKRRDERLARDVVGRDQRKDRTL